MSHILIVYGTTDGHTAKVAAAIREGLLTTGAEPEIVMAGTGDPQPSHYAGVIVAASVHAGGYQKSVERWVRAHAAELALRPSAFVSVCLGVLEKNPRVDTELAASVAQFTRETRWQPTMIKHVAGALMYTKYGFFKRWIMKRIVAKAGGDTDVTRDYEYTDWKDVRAFAEQFGRQVRMADAPAALAAAG